MQSLVYHHNPDEVPPADRPFVTLVALANSYANLLKIGSAGDVVENHHPIIPYLLEQSRLDWTILNSLRDQVLEAIEKARIFLEISHKG
jgi:hypothetical protein